MSDSNPPEPPAVDGRATEKSNGAGEVRPVVGHREELIYLLTEAAELEHGLMCSYLFAAFSLKRPGSDLRSAEQAAVDGWRRAILSVAMEEMLHLALVQNLLAALGAAPHLQRPNFPVVKGLYPCGVVVELSRFDVDTLDHFIFLERPEQAVLEDGEGFGEAAEYERPQRTASLTPSAQDYPSIGALYRGIEVGFERLADALGEAHLIRGNPEAQVDAALLRFAGLHAVTDLPSAKRAIERIIEQGEGGRRRHETSHFERFTGIRRELDELMRARPDFEPAHPVVRNPVMNAPADHNNCTHIDAYPAARVLDLATAAYALMVQLLMCFFCANGSAHSRRRLIDGAITLMSSAVGPLAELLATLPASSSAPEQTAGLSFTLPRSIQALPRLETGIHLLRERAQQIAAAAAALAPEVEGSSGGRLTRTLSGISVAVHALAGTLLEPEAASPSAQ